MSQDCSAVAARPLFVLSGAALANAHTFFAYSAFVLAFVVGCWLHYDKICTNEWFGPPQEWMPSVSATIGDRHPPRGLFQILIAACAGPRAAVLALWYIMTRRVGSRLPFLVMLSGVIRLASALGWMMITSGDDHDTHDICMFAFLIATPLWMGGSTVLAPAGPSKRWKKYAAIGFFSSIPPMIYLFIQHKVKQVPGAYSRYAYFEWNLILCDLGFDASFAVDLGKLKISISETASPATKVVEEPKVPAVKVVDALKWRDVAAFISDSVLGYCFFTTLTSLGPCIFFFNVYSMGMAGQEALLLTNLAVIFVFIGPLRRFVAKYAAVFQLLSLGGLLGYRDDYETHRLAYISAATALQSFTYASMWHSAHDKPAVLELQGRALGVGIIATVVAKLANHSLNPAWPIVDHRSGGHNAVVLSFAGLACLEKMMRPSVGKAPSPSPTGRPSLLAAVGFGALLSGIHQFLSDSGSIIARTWTGYPITGPVPIPHGAFVVLAMAIGLSLPPLLILHVFASVGLVALHFLSDWPAFAGGLIFAVYAMSLLPSMLRRLASQPNPALSFGVAFLVYDLFVLADVWTVAYAFVPGGWLLRERSWWVNYAIVICLGLASLEEVPKISSPRSATMSRIAAAFLVALAGSACAFRMQKAVRPEPHFPEERVLTAGIWTVHFGLDGWMWESQRRMGTLIEDVQLDVVGLLESDLHRIVFGNRDLSQYISETLGYYVDIGPGPEKHTWGAALLSKFPIINSTHHLLPSPVGELAPAIHATLDVYGSYIDVIVAHNGQEEDPHDRELQSEYMGRIMRDAYPRPFIFLGYVVTKPHQDKPAPYRYLVDDGKMLDIDPTDHDRWCEYILYRGLRKVAYARITRGSLPSVTDTELQTARFVVPITPLDPDVDVTSNRRVAPDSLPSSHQYSPRFGGEGVRGHKYQVLGNGNEALYYHEE